jgi:hypothetical protein
MEARFARLKALIISMATHAQNLFHLSHGRPRIEKLANHVGQMLIQDFLVELFFKINATK